MDAMTNNTVEENRTAELAEIFRALEGRGAVNGMALAVVYALERLDRMAAAFEVLAAASLEAPEDCTHPAELRSDSSVMGRERWVCACGFSVDRALSSDGAPEGH
jgi:hypothetical protein